MPPDDDAAGLTARVRSVWRRLAAASDAFTAPGVEVVNRPASKLCPPGWVGVVRLDASALVVAPTADLAARIAAVTGECTARSACDPTVAGTWFPVAAAMGPASLGYADAATASLLLSAGVGRGALDDPDVVTLMHEVGSGEVAESGLAAVTSPLFVIREGGQVVSAAGYRIWADAFAHLSVLTAADRRGEGLARRAASAAAAHALGSDLVLQWRAAPVESRAVGRALGFRELGAQLSLLPAA